LWETVSPAAVDAERANTDPDILDRPTVPASTHGRRSDLIQPEISYCSARQSQVADAGLNIRLDAEPVWNSHVDFATFRLDLGPSLPSLPD